MSFFNVVIQPFLSLKCYRSLQKMLGENPGQGLLPVVVSIFNLTAVLIKPLIWPCHQTPRQDRANAAQRVTQKRYMCAR